MHKFVCYDFRRPKKCWCRYRSRATRFNNHCLVKDLQSSGCQISCEEDHGMRKKWEKGYCSFPDVGFSVRRFSSTFSFSFFTLTTSLALNTTCCRDSGLTGHQDSDRWLVTRSTWRASLCLNDLSRYRHKQRHTWWSSSLIGDGADIGYTQR